MITEHLWLRHGSKVSYHPEIECLIADICVHAQSNIIGTRFNVSVEGLQELVVWDLGAALLNWQSSGDPDIEDWLLDHLTKNDGWLCRPGTPKNTRTSAERPGGYCGDVG